MRYSAQRELVFDIVKCSNDHPSAEMVYERAKQKIDNISLGTVYRNLKLLVDLGKIQEIEIVGAGNRFDKTIEAHSHFQCKNCGKVFDVESTSIEKLNKEVEKDTGNKVEFSEILFVGTCKNCLKI